MPELPEVETITRGLAEVLQGKQIKHFEVRLPKMFIPDDPNRPDSWKQRMLGARITRVERRGKAILIRLSTDSTLVIHLKMTGQLIYRERGQTVLAGGHPTADIALGEYPVKATHAVFTFKDGSELFFNDQRTFGYIKLLADSEVEALPLLATFGPDPLSRSFTFMRFADLLARRSSAKLKVLLLDQTFIAGLGNIYVDESLNLAKLHPLRTAGSLSPAERRSLYDAIRTILRLALKHQGTSDNTYVNILGGKGDYLKYARVYHRTDEPCLACGSPIRRMVVAGRGTHYCPKCQTAPLSRPRRVPGPAKAKGNRLGGRIAA